MFVIVWEFQAKPGYETAFEQAYGPEGAWVQFFGRAEGYLRTEFFRDIHSEGNYLTIDYWTSQNAYDTFRTKWMSEYEALDQRCESLTDHEEHIGSFVSAHE